MDEKELDRIIQQASEQELRLPKGLEERLSRHIDMLAEKEQKTRIVSMKPRKKAWLWASVASAAACICLGWFFFAHQPESTFAQFSEDTYTNPDEAEKAACKALAYMGSKLRKGLEQVNDASEKISQANEKVYKLFQ
ncbi:MAG: hypothetical protein MJZ69_10370 [Bacteroidaceae bacterium]|nr:hypothetical protein [Bacteroidaceae bacterium]